MKIDLQKIKTSLKDLYKNKSTELFNYLNRKIITYAEKKEYADRLGNWMIITLSVAIMFLATLTLQANVKSLTLTDCFMIFCYPFVVSLLTIFYSPRNNTFKFALMFFPQRFFFQGVIISRLHKFLPGRAERDVEIENFRGQGVRNLMADYGLHGVNDVLRGLAQPNVFDKLVNQFESDPDTFLKDRINLTGPLKRFILERIKFDGQIMTAKLLFLKLIPKSKQMPSDVLREIILANNIMSDIRILRSPEEVDKIILNIDSYFEKFSIAQIKSVFTRPFSFPDYVAFLFDLEKFESNGGNHLLEPQKTITEVIEESEYHKAQIRGRLRHSFLTNMKSKEFVVKILLSKKDFEKAGKSFVNCVRGYAEGSSDVFTVSTPEGMPLACVEVSNGLITQLSGLSNGQVSKDLENKVRDMFNEAKGLDQQIKEKFLASEDYRRLIAPGPV